MVEQFKHLFTPIRIGSVEIKNRICFLGLMTGYYERETGLPTERLAYFYAERAKGGVGLIIYALVQKGSITRQVMNTVGY